MAEASGDLTGNKIADKITKASKTLPLNVLETVRRETENIARRKIYILRRKYRKLLQNNIDINI